MLAGNMLNLGVTLPLCDVVMLLNDSLSSDKIFQQIYRCMTEAKGKNFGSVVDMNISRVLNTCINYSIHKNNKSTDEKLAYLIENHLINIDVDMMEQKKINSTALVSKLMEIWKSDPVNNFQLVLRNLENEIIGVDNETQKKMNSMFTRSLKGDTINTTVNLRDDGDVVQELPSGREVISEDGESTEESEENPSIQEIAISFAKDVLRYVIPLICVLTIKTVNKDFVKMLNDIKQNPELLEIFDDMCIIWWKKKGLLLLASMWALNHPVGHLMPWISCQTCGPSTPA